MFSIRSLPTFQIYRRGAKVAEQIGANPNLEAWLLEHDNAVPAAFSGSGRTLGGATLTGWDSHWHISALGSLRKTPGCHLPAGLCLVV